MTKEDLSVLTGLLKDVEAEKEEFIRLWKNICKYIGLAYGDWSKDPNSIKLPEYENADTTASNASKILADGVEGYAFSSNMEWFDFAIKHIGEETDEKLARSLLEKCREGIYKIFAESDFYDDSRGFVRSGADLATAVMNFSFDKKKDRFRYTTKHLKDVFPVSNEYGEVESMFTLVYLTRKQAINFFGEDAVPKEVKDNKSVKDKHVFVNFVGPVLDYDFEVSGDGDYMSVWWYDKDPEKVLKEERMSDKGFACWRYAKPVYGGTWGVDSPGMISLPVMHFLNILVEDFVMLGELQAKGHWKKTKGLKVNFKAGGVTELESGQDFAYVGASGDLSWLQAQIEHYRQVINENYNTDLFLVLTQNLERSKTATEVTGIENEKNNLMAAFFTRLAKEFLEPVVMWTFKTALLYAKIPGVTVKEIETLKDLDFEIQFTSPTYRAQERAFLLTSSLQWVNDTMALAQMHPDVMDRIDWDRLIEIDHKVRHASSELLVSKEDADALRTARAQANAAAMKKQEQIQDAQVLSGIYKDLTANGGVEQGKGGTIQS